MENSEDIQIRRAVQTVEGIAERNGVNIIIDSGFRERKLSDGAVENFGEVVLKIWENFNFTMDGGESSHKAQDRGVQALKNVLNKYGGDNIVIGTHGNIMVLIMNYFDKKFALFHTKSLFRFVKLKLP